ncbi:PIG-L family deacetylase [Candidatus Dojkabacteria bacterium]|uniref:PIG-L family deacetylase n=1 Tax=Candidatus Dojkabacteria bacterium TaxID=2099670 RepID=A0A955L2Q6_9BACT|nr:PIG-L family deacetylase [Candidatus Dojkabacteria bacterium]
MNLSELKLENGKKALFVFPHPDDEQAFATGLCLNMLKHGMKIKSICITKGEKSTLRYGLSENANLGETRAEEYKNACAILKLDDSIIYDYQDGGVNMQADEMKQMLIQEIDSGQYDYISTFEPDGVYGHPDHIALSRIVTEIYKEKANFKLIYATVNGNFDPDQGSKDMADDYSKIKPIKPNLTLKLSPRQMRLKGKALSAHKSQTSPHFRLRNLPQIVKFLRNEYHYIVE